MYSIKEQAIALRVKGCSYSEINRLFGVPKSTLSNWLSGIILSDEAKKIIKSRLAKGFINRNKEQTINAQNRAKEIRLESSKEIDNLLRNDLLLIGVTLYWAEGYKRLKVRNNREITSHMIALTNSDPDIVSTFILFLIRILNIPIDKIFIEMRLFKHIDSHDAILYWMKVTSLPESQFKKPLYPISKASQGKRPKNRLPYGTVRVIVSDTRLFHKVLGFIDGLKERLKVLYHAEVAQW